MSNTQIATFVQVPIDYPTAKGRIASGKFGYMQFLSTANIETLDGNNPGPDAEPVPDSPALIGANTALTDSKNAAQIQPATIARDMNFTDWTILGAQPGAIKLSHPLDPANRAHFFISTLNTHQGENFSAGGKGPAGGTVGGTLMGGAPYTEAAIAQRLGNQNNIHFISNWTLENGQGWDFLHRFYNQQSALLDVFPGILQVYHNGLLLNMWLTLIDLFLLNALRSTAGVVAITWGIDGPTGLQWKLVLSSTHDWNGLATLWKSTQAGAPDSWKLVAKHPYAQSEPSLSQRQNLGWLTAHFQVIGGTANFSIHPTEIWKYRDPENTAGFVSPAGRVHIQWFANAGLMLFNATGLRHISPTSNVFATIQTTNSLSVPAQVNPDFTLTGTPPPYELRLYPRDTAGNDATSSSGVNVVSYVTADPADTTRYFIHIDFVDNGNGAVTSPAVMGVQEVRRPIVEVISNPTPPDMGADTLSAEWRINHKHRNSELTVKAKNERGQWSTVQPGQVISLSTAVMTGVGTSGGSTSTSSFTQMFSGRIEKVRFTSNAHDFPGTPGIVDVTARGVEARLDRKRMTDYGGGFGGWTLLNAAENILSRSGVAPACYDFSIDATRNTGIPPALVLPSIMVPTGKGNPSYTYDEHSTARHAMDEIFAALQMEWGEYPDGVVRAWRIGTYDNSFTYTLDDSTFDPGVDMIEEIQVDQSLQDFVNVLRAHAKDANGIDQVASTWDPHSIYDSTSPNYVGDDLWYSHFARAGADPLKEAQGKLAQLMGYRTIVSWKTDMKPQLIPRMKVTVNLTNMSVPNSTNYLVTDVTGRQKYRDDLGTGTCDFILAIPKQVEGGINP